MKNNMKRLTVFWVSLVAIVMGFTACNNDADEPDNGSRFAFDADNRCYLPGVKTITYDEFLKYAAGNGWDHVSTYEINKDGSVKETEYYTDLDGAVPSDYYFVEDRLAYRYVSLPEGVGFKEIPYIYHEDGNRLGWNDRLDDSFFTQFQILTISENEFKAVEYLAYRAGENGGHIYGLATYAKMDEKQREGFLDGYRDYMSTHAVEPMVLAYSVEKGVLEIRILNFTVDCGAESVEYEFQHLDNGKVQVNVVEVGENSANCVDIVDLKFTVPDVKVGETYTFDIYRKYLAGGHLAPYFEGVSIRVTEGGSGIIPRE